MRKIPEQSPEIRPVRTEKATMFASCRSPSPSQLLDSSRRQTGLCWQRVPILSLVIDDALARCCGAPSDQQPHIFANQPQTAAGRDRFPPSHMRPAVADIRALAGMQESNGMAASGKARRLEKTFDPTLWRIVPVPNTRAKYRSARML